MDKQRFTEKQRPTEKRSQKDFGNHCEELAAIFITKSGYEIIDRNVRLGRGEIDIIATTGETICFIEVKASCTLRFGLPEERVNSKKQTQLIKLAKLYLLKNRDLQRRFDPRFDVISIIKEENYDEVTYDISHITDAFRL